MLNKHYPDARCGLEFHNLYQLLVSTVLSAQATDKKVNEVTPVLFKTFPDFKSLSEADVASIEEIIKPLGFFHQKAKNLKSLSTEIQKKFNGIVPKKMESLITLSGVGRKTANIVLGTGYGIISGIVVDTHVKRLTRRFGLTRHEDAEKIETDLMQLLDKDRWIDWSHLLINHGRKVCNARKPDCTNCIIESLCMKIDI